MCYRCVSQYMHTLAEIKGECLSRFGEWLTQRLKAKRMNGRQFAMAAGLTPSVVTDWVRKGTRPQEESLRAIAPILGATVEEMEALFEDQNRPTLAGAPSQGLADAIKALHAAALVAFKNAADAENKIPVWVASFWIGQVAEASSWRAKQEGEANGRAGEGGASQ